MKKHITRWDLSLKNAFRILYAMIVLVSFNMANAQSFTYSDGSGAPPSVSSDDLLQTYGSVSASLGTFDNEGTGGISVLTDGVATNSGSGRAGIGNNSSITYSLDVTTNPGGYLIDEISIYTGWGDGGRLNPNVTVYYSSVTDPTNFILLGTASYTPTGGSNPWSKSTYTPNTGSLSNVAAIRFDFGNQQNGYVGYTELDVIGSVAPPVVNVTGVSVTGSNVALNNSNNWQTIIFPIVYPSNAVNLKVTWSSNTHAVALVVSNTSNADAGSATVTGVANGEATITGQTVDGGFQTYVFVTVTGLQPPVYVQSVSIVPRSLYFEGTGGTSTLGVAFTPANPTNQVVYYSTDNPNVAIVDANGIVTAIGNDGNGNDTDGQRTHVAYIKASTDDGGKIDSIPVTVHIPVTNAQWKTNAYLNDDQLYLQFNPSEASNRQFKAVSSNPAVVSVDVNNSYSLIYINRLSNGTVTITATSLDNPTISIAHEFTVTDRTATGVNLTDFSFSISQHLFDNYAQLYDGVISSSFTPLDATNKRVFWTKTAPDSIVSFAGNVDGLRSLKAPAIFTITGTTEDGLFSHSDVVGIPPHNLTNTNQSIDLNIDNTPSVNAKNYITASPSIGQLLNSFTFTSSNSAVASVDPITGITSGHQPGTAQIIGSVDFTPFGGQIYYDTLNVAVSGTFPVTSVSVSGVTPLALNNTLDLSAFAVIAPSYATNPALHWSSSNSSVATVNSTTGLALGIGLGVTTINAITIDNSAISASFVLTVVSIPVASLSSSVSSTIVGFGNSIDISALVNVLPSNASFKTITYSSSDASLVSVDPSTGVATGVASGTATITGTSVDNSAATASVVVTVITPVTSISITGNNLVTKGQSTQLTAIVLPATATDASVVWSSSSNSTASVSGTGFLTGRAVGVVTITATSVSTPSIKAVFVVGILPIDVASITVSGLSTLTVGGVTTLTSIIAPIDATSKLVTWYSSDPTIVSVNSVTGVIRALSAGTTTIIATAINSTISGSISITVVNAPNLAIQDELSSSIVLYPNPIVDVLNVGTIETVKSLKVLNTLGVVVASSSNATSIGFEGLPSGLYLVVIETTAGTVKKSVVK